MSEVDRGPETNVPSLDGLRMHAVKTAPNGVINVDTIFRFSQRGNRVWAEYAGGRIERGYLVGTLDADRLTFRYCQMQEDGVLDGGESKCEVEFGSEGLIQIIERFEWGSRPGGGTNVIRQLPSSAPEG